MQSFLRRQRLNVAGALILGICAIGAIAHFVAKQCLFNAVARDDIVTVSTLLSWDCFLTSSTDRVGLTALDHAVEAGNLELVQLLILKGSNVNHDSPNAMPLHIAAFSGRTDIIEELLKAGGNVDSESDWSPITFVGTPLHQAAAAGKVDAVRILLAHGANVNAKERLHGRTPLFFVISPIPVSTSRDDSLDLLLSNGADANALDDDGQSAMSYVKNIPDIYDTKNMIRLLKDHGAE